MLITETVTVKIHSNNQQYYLDKGYDIPKVQKRYKTVVLRGTTIQVKVRDLQRGASYKIKYKCEECGKEIEVPYYSYVTNEYEDICQPCMIRSIRENDLTGQIVGRLTVLERIGKKRWLCQCSCGKLVKVFGNNLTTKHTQSCGCLDFEKKRARRGSKHPLWKGGVATQNMKERGSFIYKIWRKSIFIRDNYTCQKCSERGGTLNAHHIESFSIDKLLRTDLNNGVTFCKDCHRKFHLKYGQITTRIHLNDYLKFEDLPTEVLEQNAHVADILEKAGYRCEKCLSFSNDLCVYNDLCLCSECFVDITSI